MTMNNSAISRVPDFPDELLDRYPCERDCGSDKRKARQQRPYVAPRELLRSIQRQPL